MRSTRRAAVRSPEVDSSGLAARRAPLVAASVLVYARGMRTVLPCLLLAACVACESTSAHRAQPKAAPAAEPPSVAAQVEALEAASRPGPMHQRLAVLIGDWDTNVVRVAPDGTEIPAGSGRTSITPLFEGRYLRWDASLDLGQRTQETTGWLGYDRTVGEYQLCMITSFSSGMGIFRGQGDLTREGILFVLERLDSATGARLEARNRLKLLTPEHFVIEDEDEDRRVRTRSHYRRIH